MAGIIDAVNDKGRQRLIQPLFITCDPGRDDPAALKTYLSGTLLLWMRLICRVSSGYNWADGELGGY
jgi:cytochrome oxidase Cu insertion factor (SCO1/SenC/PrrC family)